MNEVEAVKTVEEVKMVSNLLGKHHGQQMKDVWDLGLQLALRISDLLTLTVDDCKNGEVRIKESKTGKTAVIKLNEKAQEIVNRIAGSGVTYLFQSMGRNSTGKVRPITRQAVGQAFKDVGEIVGIKLSTHSMRKTRGFIVYQQTNNLALVMKMLRHSNAGVTLRYIGVDKHELDNLAMEVIL